MRPDYGKALSALWKSINRSVFGGALMVSPTIEVAPNLHHHSGEWCPSTRTLRMSLQFVEESPWLRVEEVMKHEMAHQYVSDVLGIEGEETAHGPAFRMVCDRYGIDGGTTLRRSEEEQAIVEKARKLLRLSESPNVHEAEAALTALQRLLGRNGLSEADIL